MNISTSLCFDGRCEEALRFYERVLGAKTAFSMKWGESPMADQVPTQWHGKIIHDGSVRYPVDNQLRADGVDVSAADHVSR